MIRSIVGAKSFCPIANRTKSTQSSHDSNSHDVVDRTTREKSNQSTQCSTTPDTLAEKRR
jgi:hypothetical protein